MQAWLSNFQPVRSLPRLWVQTVWLLESREPLVITRSIHLHPGLNIVWAREPVAPAAGSLASAGHGVGKTSLCLLLRYLLGDEAPAIATLREKAAGSFAKGGVAAQVHVDGVAWLVFRPYGQHALSKAARADDLAALLNGSVASDFDGYQKALEAASIGRLAARSLPGTNQPFQWGHQLAWCIRDQKTRFDQFFHWRGGEGLGFKRPRRDPPFFVGAVLGLVDAELDKLMREAEAEQNELDQVKAGMPDLERRPALTLSLAEQRLRIRVKAGEDEPVFQTTLLEPSVQSRVSEVLKAAEAQEVQWEQQYETDAARLVEAEIALRELRSTATRAEAESGVAQALLDGNEASYNAMARRRDELAGLTGRCAHGDVEFADCDYVRANMAKVSLPWRMSELEAKAKRPELASNLERWQKGVAAAQAEVEKQTQRVSNARAELRRLRTRIATSENARSLLKKEWGEFDLLYRQHEKGESSAELVREKERHARLEQELASLQAAIVQRKTQQSSRKDAIKALTASVAERLLGRAGHARYRPESDERPFEVAKGGEAYQVLEVLLGDLVCLLDSATSEGSHHPGFLVHDCPREADMSGHLYRDFFLTAAEAAKQWAQGDEAPFQFIVTTTSAPPDELQKAPTMVLELQPGDEGALLFKRELAPMLVGFAE